MKRSIKILLLFVLPLILFNFTRNVYSAFTAKAQLAGQLFTTEKQLTKEELSQQVETTFIDNSEDFTNLLDSSLEYLVDKDTLNQALNDSDLKIVSLRKISEIREKDNNWAEVDYLVTYNNGSTAKFTAVLHFEYGTWKLFGTVPLED